MLNQLDLQTKILIRHYYPPSFRLTNIYKYHKLACHPTPFKAQPAPPQELSINLSNSILSVAGSAPDDEDGREGAAGVAGGGEDVDSGRGAALCPCDVVLECLEEEDVDCGILLMLVALECEIEICETGTLWRGVFRKRGEPVCC